MHEYKRFEVNTSWLSANNYVYIFIAKLKRYWTNDLKKSAENTTHTIQQRLNE